MTIRPLHISFVCIADLPYGGGNTTRLTRLTNTLKRCGHEVRIWNEHGLDVGPRSLHQAAGEVEGVPYEYVLGETERSAGFGMIGAKLNAVRALTKRIKDYHSRGELDVLWFNNLSFYDTWPLTRLASSLGVATIQSYEDERFELVSEGPLSFSRKLFAINSWLADKICPNMADAVVVISHFLREKYSKLTAPEKIYLVPTIIDCNEWSAPSEPTVGDPLIVYAGTFSEQDAMTNLVKALALLRDRGCAFRANLLGGNVRAGSQAQSVTAMLDELRLHDHVTMSGFVPLVEVKQKLAEAAILVNIRRDGIWSRSGLSTKLSEYLASGRLVISSDVGEVRYYLTHNVNALIVSASASAQEIADTLQEGLASRDLRVRLGATGRAVAREYFDTLVVAKTLKKMLTDIT